MSRSRWGVSVILRSGRHILVVCPSERIAEAVLTNWQTVTASGEKFVEFPSVMGTKNLTLASEIVSMSVIDYEFADELAIEDHKALNRIKREADYDPDGNEGTNRD